jgi:zinc transport system substrate-binding protein
MQEHELMRRIDAVRLLLLVLFTLGSISMTGAVLPSSRLAVYTTNYPLEYFANRIAGDLAGVLFPAPADVDPAFWVPDEATLLGYQQADLILLNGAGYERWTATISLPLNLVVDTTRSKAEQYIYSDDAVTHTHGPSGEHAHDNLAFTTWLDMQLAAGQARSIAGALIKLMPEHEDSLTQNLHALVEELDQLDADLQSISDVFGNNPLLASHPVYQYFSRRYRLDLHSLHWEPDEAPSVREWQQLEVLLEKLPAKWMIWEAPPLPETSSGLSRLGVTSLVFYPLANKPLRGDFTSVMQQNVETLRRIVENASPQPEKRVRN